MWHPEQMSHLLDESIERLLNAVMADPVCAAILDRMPSLGLPEWWLTAGAVFQNVWNSVEGFPPGFGIKDYDIFYFDDGDLGWGAEDSVIRKVADLFTDLTATVEIRNQARVHLWYEEKFGVAGTPYRSATDAIESFASTTCCVGLTRNGSEIEVFAPYGLDDVFGMHMRPHKRIAPQAVYDSKVEQYRNRWPSLTADAW